MFFLIDSTQKACLQSGPKHRLPREAISGFFLGQSVSIMDLTGGAAFSLWQPDPSPVLFFLHGRNKTFAKRKNIH